MQAVLLLVHRLHRLATEQGHAVTELDGDWYAYPLLVRVDLQAGVVNMLTLS